MSDDCSQLIVNFTNHIFVIDVLRNKSIGAEIVRHFNEKCIIAISENLQLLAKTNGRVLRMNKSFEEVV